MRIAMLLVLAILAIGLLLWQARLMPQPVSGFIDRGEQTVLAWFGKDSDSSAAAPQWPDALDPGVRRGPPIWILAAAGLGLAAAIGILLLRRQQRTGGSTRRLGIPEWLTAARGVASASSDGRERRQHCNLIEKSLVPDLRHRGAAALANAHQIDLYARFAGRKPAGARSARKQAERIRMAAKEALDTIARATAQARNLAAFKAAQGSLWALEAGDARELRRYYEELAKLLDSHDKAFARAHTAIAAPALDEPALQGAMEDLRQINRQIAKASAALVGDIEISVRAVHRAA